jgi:hypothetical protein
MKTKLKKTVLAAAATAAMAGSMSANAIITGVPGQAFLIPYFGFRDDAGDLNGVDTLAKLIVPRAVGSDVVFWFTSPRETSDIQTNEDTELQKGLDYCIQGSSNPVCIPDGNGAHVHWYWMNEKSVKLKDGIKEVTPDDVVLLQASRMSPALDINVNGYLVVVTDAGSTSKPASFSFFADAWMTFGKFGSGSQGVASIPALPLADSESDAGKTTPSTFNNVIILGGSPRVSPLISGTRLTNDETGTPLFRVVDVPLGDRDYDAVDTLVFSWIDHNQAAVNSEGVSITLPSIVKNVNEYDDDEHQCSDAFELPYELNVSLVTEYSGQKYGKFPSYTTDLCNPRARFGGPRPVAMGFDDSKAKAYGGGFVKLGLQENRGIAGKNVVTGSFVMWSIPVVVNDSTHGEMGAAYTYPQPKGIVNAWDSMEAQDDGQYKFDTAAE